MRSSPRTLTRKVFFYEGDLFQCFFYLFGTTKIIQKKIKKEYVDERTSTNRLKKIQELLLNQQTNFNDSFIDKTVEVLVSSRAKKNNQFVGRTKHLQPVHFFSTKNVVGKTLKVKINNRTSFSLHGKVLN